MKKRMSQLQKTMEYIALADLAKASIVYESSTYFLLWWSIKDRLKKLDSYQLTQTWLRKLHN